MMMCCKIEQSSLIQVFHHCSQDNKFPVFVGPFSFFAGVGGRSDTTLPVCGYILSSQLDPFFRSNRDPPPAMNYEPSLRSIAVALRCDVPI